MHVPSSIVPNTKFKFKGFLHFATAKSKSRRMSDLIAHSAHRNSACRPPL